MAQRVFATTAQYGDLAEEPFADAALLQKRLRQASVEVEKLTLTAVYDVDSDGLPTDQNVADALAEATCAIVEYWQETDDPTGAAAAEGAVKIGSVSLGTTSSASDTSAPLEKLQRRIGTRAYDILANAGLISAAVAH